MNLIIQYGLLGLVLGLGLGLGFILYCKIWRPWHYVHVLTAARSARRDMRSGPQAQSSWIAFKSAGNGFKLDLYMLSGCTQYDDL